MTHEEVDRGLRFGLLGVYGFLTAAGVAANLTVAPSMLEELGDGWRIQLWGLLLLAGASTCLVGVAVPRGARGDWFGEFVGLPVTTAAVTVYAIVAGRTVDDVPGRAIGVLLLCSFAALMAVRWWRVFDDARRDAGRKPAKSDPPTPSPT